MPIIVEGRFDRATRRPSQPENGPHGYTRGWQSPYAVRPAYTVAKTAVGMGRRRRQESNGEPHVEHALSRDCLHPRQQDTRAALARRRTVFLGGSIVVTVAISILIAFPLRASSCRRRRITSATPRSSTGLTIAASRWNMPLIRASPQANLPCLPREARLRHCGPRRRGFISNQSHDEVKRSPHAA